MCVEVRDLVEGALSFYHVGPGIKFKLSSLQQEPLCRPSFFPTLAQRYLRDDDGDDDDGDGDDDDDDDDDDYYYFRSRTNKVL